MHHSYKRMIFHPSVNNTYTNGTTLPVSQLEQGGATEVLVSWYLSSQGWLSISIHLCVHFLSLYLKDLKYGYGLNYKNFSYFANTWNLFPVYTFYTHIWFVGKWFNWNWQLASYFRLQKKRRMIIICRWLWSLL